MVSIVVPTLTALGAGGLIVGWVGASKSRREVRSAILKAIASTETERWAGQPHSADYPKFVTSVRELETAALIARIPREAVRHYVVLANAARHLSDDAFDVQYPEEELGGPINGYFDTLVRDGADVLTRLAWSPWRTRLTLRSDLKKLRTRALTFTTDPDDARIKWRLARAQKTHGLLPGALGEIPGIKDPPLYVERQNTQEPPKKHY